MCEIEINSKYVLLSRRTMPVLFIANKRDDTLFPTQYFC